MGHNEQGGGEHGDGDDMLFEQQTLTLHEIPSPFKEESHQLFFEE